MDQKGEPQAIVHNVIIGKKSKDAFGTAQNAASNFTETLSAQ
jgi:hypothetical protein